ncbi:MAG: lipase maturation factor family protein [Acidobacteriia bacterium]|nr:lipase maturation factor family protein [Terriglobia bacterium]
MIRTLLRALGLVYFIAFVSFGTQAAGLIGSHGILPFGDYLKEARVSLGAAAYWEVPSVLWARGSDGALTAVWVLGASCALVAIAGYRLRIALAACLVLWLSLCSVGQDFLSYQWDVLLLEAGFLAIFADDSPARVWLFRWLIFRLMFFSGAGKLLTGDPTWRNLTALHFHYETQPLPTPVAWYLDQLPLWFQKISTAFVLAAEEAVPFLFFAPRRLRQAGAGITILLQLLILIAGNYTFFNFLTILLALFLLVETKRASQSRTHRIVSAGLVTFVGVTSALLFLELFRVDLPRGGAAILRGIAPMKIVNSYGLFTVMTVRRPEIVVEGSQDGETWRAYEFPYKPGNVMRAPPVVAPLQPRLDWQMWFAALGTRQENPWFTNFMIRLLEGEPSVLRLLSYNPFPTAPPQYIRARIFLYHFTHFGERAWWRREEEGTYFPVVSLKQAQ